MKLLKVNQEFYIDQEKIVALHASGPVETTVDMVGGFTYKIQRKLEDVIRALSQTMGTF